MHRSPSFPCPSPLPPAGPPPQDYVEQTIDLNQHVSHPAATFYVRASGHSMLEQCSGLIIPDTVLGGKVATVTRGVQ